MEMGTPYRILLYFSSIHDKTPNIVCNPKDNWFDIEISLVESDWTESAQYCRRLCLLGPIHPQYMSLRKRHKSQAGRVRV